MENVAPLQAQGFNEGKGKPFTAEDVRFTAKVDVIYAIVFGWPAKPLQIKSLGKAAKLLDKPVGKVELLRSREAIRWSQKEESLTIEPPQSQLQSEAVVYKITMK